MPITIEAAQAAYDRRHGPGVVVLVPDPTPDQPNRVRLDKGPKWEAWNARRLAEAKPADGVCP